MAPQAGIKAIESFDATFELNEEQDAALRKLLATEPFCQQVVRETQQPEGTQLEFTGTCWDVNNGPAGGPLHSAVRFALVGLFGSLQLMYAASRA